MSKTAIIVDDHPMCRQATAMALHAVDPAIAVIEASSLAEARPHAATATLMTLDLALPDNRGVLGLPALRREFPDLPLLVISGAINLETERQVAAAGARGYLSKAARIGEMVSAMQAVLAAGVWFSPGLASDPDDDSEFTRLADLTAAQVKVLRAMEGGRLNKQIAHDLGLSEITIKAHVKAILKKLRVPNRTQAILMMRRAGDVIAQNGARPWFDTERIDEIRTILGRAATERLLRELANELAEAPREIAVLAESGQHAAAAAAAHRLRGAVLAPGLAQIADILASIETTRGDLQKRDARTLIEAAAQARDAIAGICDRPAERD